MNQAQVLHMIYHYLLVHCPGAREEYVSGGNPVFKAKMTISIMDLKIKFFS